MKNGANPVFHSCVLCSERIVQVHTSLSKIRLIPSDHRKVVYQRSGRNLLV